MMLRLTSLFLLFAVAASAQRETPLFKIFSSHTSFPDSGRYSGHVYNKVLYTAADHYRDSSVLVYVPPSFRPGKKTQLVFWFHGWGNNVDSAAVRYDLLNQFAASGVNAILVLAETARDAPDSYGGKLERINEFKGLVNDVMGALKARTVIHRNSRVGKVVIAGHSGAYRVMAYVLQNGQVPVDEVILFDALYAETPKFSQWIRDNPTHRFINIYTDHGGTDAETKQMTTALTSENLNPMVTEEEKVTADLLQKHRIVIIHSQHAHNDIIQRPDNFKLFMENGVLKK